MRRRLTALMVIVTCMLVPPSASAGETGVPAPKEDSFYRVPADVAQHRNGAVLGARQVTPMLGKLPAARAWQIRYRTTDARGRATATLATVLVPKAPWRGPGRRPLVSYQVAEDGVGLRCTPSYALRAGLRAGVTPAQVDLVYGVPLLLARGWAVVVPDWEGPLSGFGVHGMAGHAVLDGIRAARSFPAAGLGGPRPIGLWGYSGGGFATISAAQAHESYAPRLPITAIAAGGVPGDIRDVYDTARGNLFGGATILLLIAMDRAYPGARLKGEADSRLRRAMAASEEDCLAEAPARHPLLDIDDHLTSRGRTQFARLLRVNSPLYAEGVPRAPTYLYHATIDELVPLATARKLASRFCDAGAPVDFHVDPGGEHFVEAVLGGLKALNYLATRFRGQPQSEVC